MDVHRGATNEDELARACLARETAEQKERLRDRSWHDAQASSNRDRGNTARKKREAMLQQMSDRQCDRLAAETNEEREARLQQVRDSLLRSGLPPRCSTSI